MGRELIWANCEFGLMVMSTTGVTFAFGFCPQIVRKRLNPFFRARKNRTSQREIFSSVWALSFTAAEVNTTYCSIFVPRVFDVVSTSDGSDALGIFHGWD